MTKFRSWKVSEIVDALIGRGSKRIIIPSFQRSFVWNVDQRASLIQSIRQGFPVGCLLLFHVGYKENQEQLQIVDGLQRTVTLRKYESELFQQFGRADLDPKDLATLLGFLNSKTSTQDLESIIVGWVNSRTSFSASDGYTNVEIWMHLHDAGMIAEATPSASLMISLQQILDAIRKRLEISSYEIPVIEFSGDRDDLPAIFDRLNTGGTKLAKYDILAASWNDKHVQIKSNELIESVKSKYRELIRLGLEFDKSAGDNFEDYDATYEYLIFEFVFAVGRCLKNRFPKLYGKLAESSTEVESIGFTLVTLCSGLRIAQLGDFATIIQRFERADIYFDALCEASSFVADSLTDVFEFPLDRESPRKIQHSEFQIASIVASVFRLMFSEVLDKNDSWASAAHEIGLNIVQHYIYDHLRRFWRGSGDGKAFTFVSGSALLIGINQSSLIAALDAWFAETLRGRSKEPPVVQRVLIKLILGSRIRTYPNNGRKFVSNFLYAADELRGSGINPQNIANVIVTNPESLRRLDPCNMGARRATYLPTSDAESVFLERFDSLKSALLKSLYEEDLISEA